MLKLIWGVLLLTIDRLSPNCPKKVSNFETRAFRVKYDQDLWR